METMTSKRLNLVVMIVGGRGTGKTTYIKKHIPRYKKVIIVDTLLHPSYSEYQAIKLEMIPRWKSGIKRILVDEDSVCTLCEMLSLHFKNGAIVFEDAGKYILPNLQKQIKKILIDTKQQNNDVFILNHFWSDVSTKALKLSDRIVLFKTVDTPFSRKKELYAYELIRQTYDKVQRLPNKWDNLTIAIS